MFFFAGGVNIHETLHGACGFETMEDVTLNWNLLQLEISLSEKEFVGNATNLKEWF